MRTGQRRALKRSRKEGKKVAVAPGFEIVIRREDGAKGIGCSSSILMAWRPCARPCCDNDEGIEGVFKGGGKGGTVN